MLTCAYCKKNGHEEHHCYKKEIDELKNLLKKNQISLPSRMTTSPSSSHSNFDNGNDHMGKGQGLVATTSQDLGRWLLDLGDSHHMASL